MSGAAGLAEFKERQFIAIIGDEASYFACIETPTLAAF